MAVPVFGVAMLFANSPLIAVEVAPAVAWTAIAQQAPAVTPEAPAPVSPQDVPAIPPAVAQAPAPAPADPAVVAVPDANGDQLVDQDILVLARRRSPIDPLERVNVESYKAIQAVDRAFVAPVAMGYKKILPKPVRQGVHNFLDNIQEPIVFLNYLLQLKPGKAAETLGRFVINSTLGVAGLVDVAKRKPFKLPHRPNSLANTLGYYGVKPGPYLFLPLVGPTTVRDLFGISIDRLILPVTVGAPFDKAYYTLPVSALSALDYRVAFDDKLTVLHTATDPYAATRDDYLRKRKAEIDRLHGPNWPGHRIIMTRTVTPPAVPVLGADGALGVAVAPSTPVRTTPEPVSEAKTPEAAPATP